MGEHNILMLYSSLSKLKFVNIFYDGFRLAYLVESFASLTNLFG